MLFSNRQYLNKVGFTLIEIVVALGLVSMILTSMFSILNYSNRVSYVCEFIDEMLLNGRFGIEYIKEELRTADKLISSERIEDLNFLYPDNIGFVLFIDRIQEEPSVSADERYRFVTYYLNNDKLVRISHNKGNKEPPHASKLSGYNELIHGVLSIEETEIEHENRLVKLSLFMGSDEKEVHNFKSCIFLDTEYEF